MSLNASVSVNVSLTQSTSIKKSDYDRGCEYDYVFWVPNASEYTIVSICMHITINEYECESELECKSKQFFLIRHNIPLGKIVCYYLWAAKPTITSHNLVMLFFFGRNLNIFLHPKIQQGRKLPTPIFKTNQYFLNFCNIFLVVFSDISEQNNDYSDTLDFRRGWVGVVTVFVLEVPVYKYNVNILLYTYIHTYIHTHTLYIYIYIYG